jgi:thiamine pyrophosphate-dependent acetolactate synthase large subunit-like protein
VAGVQYGPGAEASFGAIAQAWSDGVPLLLLAGGYDSHDAGARAYRGASDLFRPIAKEPSSSTTRTAPR